RVNTFEDFRTELVEGKEKRVGTESVQENPKKQKVEDDKEIVELKQLMEIIPDEEEVSIDSIPLAVKSPRNMELEHDIEKNARDASTLSMKLRKKGDYGTLLIQKKTGAENMKRMGHDIVQDSIWEHDDDLRRIRRRWGLIARGWEFGAIRLLQRCGAWYLQAAKKHHNQNVGCYKVGRYVSCDEDVLEEVRLSALL
ncbi:hypothetical protein Tco_0445937, partial [Tanacetum coccineum]